MINEMINAYNTIKVKTILALGGAEDGINDEFSFMDDCMIAYKVKKIQKKLKIINDDYLLAEEINRKNQLLKEKDNLISEFVLLISNNFKDIDFCMTLIEKNDKFYKCLLALKQYNDNNKEEAYNLFNSYFTKGECVLNHYLIASVYGNLLYEKHEYKKALIFLKKAVELRPTEIDIHQKLLKIYEFLEDDILLNHEKEILDVLKKGDLYE